MRARTVFAILLRELKSTRARWKFVYELDTAEVFGSTADGQKLGFGLSPQAEYFSEKCEFSRDFFLKIGKTFSFLMILLKS